jgi:hypothetical protein
MRLNEPKCDKCLKTLQAERLELNKQRRGYLHDTSKDHKSTSDTTTTTTTTSNNSNATTENTNEKLKKDTYNDTSSSSTDLTQHNDDNVTNAATHKEHSSGSEYEYEEDDNEDENEDDSGESGIAIAKCLDCDLNLCSNCLLEHQIINLDMNHKLISLIMTNGAGCISQQQQRQQQQQQQQQQLQQNATTLQMQLQHQQQHLNNEINNNCLKMHDKNSSGMELLGLCNDKNINGLQQHLKSNGKCI